VLVVIGILIALQINNWNEKRKLLTEELNLTKQLLEDAKADFIFFESRISIIKTRDSIYNNLLKLDRKLDVDSISKLTIKDDPFFSILAYQSNLIHNNPNAYDFLSNNRLKSKLREYQAKYNYVAESIESSNRISEEYGVPLEIKYYNEIKDLPEKITYNNLLFALEDKETVAKFNLFKQTAANSQTQVESFLKINKELTQILETYLSEND
jgi:hypothetical protein